MDKQFSLVRPCADCPFRNDGSAISLNPGRKEEIVEGLLSGEHTAFHCHKSVYRSDGRNFDENEDYHPTDVCQCPGAVAVARKFGRDPVIVQVATRLGVIPSDHYDEAKDLTLDPADLKLDRKKARI